MGHNIPKIEYGNFAPTVIEFTYPCDAEGMAREKRVINRKRQESLSGVQQSQINYIEATRRMKFGQLTEELVDLLEDFIDNWASLGKAFKVFLNKDSAEYISYTLDQDKFDPKTNLPKGENRYLYDVELNFRRVIGQTEASGYMEIELENNVSVPADVDGLVLDSSMYRTVQIFFEIFRKTDSEERVSNGSFKCLYSEENAAWDISPPEYAGGSDPLGPCGVTFSVESGGQVQYASDDMAGTNYEGYALFRNFTILRG